MDWVGGARVNTNKKAVLPLYTADTQDYRSNQLAMQTGAQGWRFGAAGSAPEQVGGNHGGWAGWRNGGG